MRPLKSADQPVDFYREKGGCVAIGSTDKNTYTSSRGDAKERQKRGGRGEEKGKAQEGDQGVRVRWEMAFSLSALVTHLLELLEMCVLLQRFSNGNCIIVV